MAARFDNMKDEAPSRMHTLTNEKVASRSAMVGWCAKSHPLGAHPPLFASWMLQKQQQQQKTSRLRRVHR